jgi:hypothetical protein
MIPPPSCTAVARGSNAWSRWGRRALSLAIAVSTGAGVGCGSGPGAAGGDGGADTGDKDASVDGPSSADPSDALFDPAHIVEVDITMLPADWDALRTQTRPLDILLGEGCTSAPFVSPFNEYPATVNIDGMTLTNVSVRKKGFLGSLDDRKPSIKIDLDEYVDGQEFAGVDSITLNNNRQDPAFIRQCLSYEIFRRAGVPASRCNFARVTVNGDLLGVYSNVEAVSKRFLRRHYGDDAGRLYEGTLSDFRTGWTGTFDPKTDRDNPDRSDILAVEEALLASDSELLTALEPLVDVDQFLTFWATEVLIGHVDGYANNTNNFFVYDDPASGRFDFLPWGVDGTLRGGNAFGAGAGAPEAVYATGVLARRLYLLPATRARYIARIHELLDSAWDEPALLGAIARMEALLTPAVEGDLFFGEDGASLAAQVNSVRGFVSRRRAVVEEELASPPAWTYPLRESFCFVEVGDVTATFDTTFGSVGAENVFAEGTGSLTGVLWGDAFDASLVGSVAGADPDNALRAQVTIVGQVGPTRFLFVSASIDAGLVAPNTSVALGIGGNTAYMLDYSSETETAELVGLSWNGVLELDQAAGTSGAPVSGTFAAHIVEWPF